MHHCRKLSGKFQVGKNSVQAFKYVSVNIVQHSENITLDQTDYISSIQSTQIFHDKQIENNNLQICKQQFTEYWQLTGILNWIANQSRPDISFDVCHLSSKINYQLLVT